MPGVRLEKVSKRYGRSDVMVVKDLSLHVMDGEFIVILGPSGCGKSTTLRMVAGLERVSTGRVFIGESDVTDVRARDRNIAMVFQSYALYPHMTVWKNIAFGLLRRKIARPEVARRVGDAARMLELSAVLNRRPAQLSGGQRQRVALARGIVREPAVFLFDEPLSNLDAALRARTRDEMIRQHQRMGTTMIYVTHDQVEAMTMGDRICVMREGELVQIGSPMDVYRHPVNAFVARFLGNPPMNILRLRCWRDARSVVIEWGSQRTVISPLKELPPGVANGGIVAVGIRPEDVAVVGRDEIRVGNRGEKDSVRGRIGAMEALGADMILRIDFEGVREEFKARVPPYRTFNTGEVVSVVVAGDKVKFFEEEGKEEREC